MRGEGERGGIEGKERGEGERGRREGRGGREMGARVTNGFTLAM